jgi:hypothetical protein
MNFSGSGTLYSYIFGMYTGPKFSANQCGKRVDWLPFASHFDLYTETKVVALERDAET